VGEDRGVNLDPGDMVVAARELGDAGTGFVNRGTDGIVTRSGGDSYTVVFTSPGFLADTTTTLSGLTSADLVKR
jgi:hypothetical protein